MTRTEEIQNDIMMLLEHCYQARRSLASQVSNIINDVKNEGQKHNI